MLWKTGQIHVWPSLWNCLIAGGLMLLIGCDSKPAPAPVTKTVVVDIPQEPSQIELSEAKVVLKPGNLVAFEVKYKFIKGKPLKYYLLNIDFTGTENRGIKYMDGWELKESGVIKDGVQIQSPVTTFEIKMSEANHPEQGYDLISNILTGDVEQ